MAKSKVLDDASYDVVKGLVFEEKEKNVRKSIYIPKEIDVFLQQCAEEQGKTYNKIVTRILKHCKHWAYLEDDAEADAYFEKGKQKEP